MFRPTGEAVLLDFGLSHHDQLPDLMQEEFRLPFGTAPYMSPEQLLGIRNDPRSDLFALGVLLYFFSTGVRPFGESETLRGMRRRLWRDPVPPRRLRPDYPPWLQEIVLRCLEIEPAWRYPTAAQLAFDLTHPDEVKLTTRSERLRRDPSDHRAAAALQHGPDAAGRAKPALAAQLSSAPIVAVAIDLDRRIDGAQRRAARHRRAHSGDAAVGAARLPQRAQAGPAHHRHHPRRARPQQADRPPGRASALGGAAEARRTPAHRARARGASIRRPPSSNSRKPTAIDHILIGARQNSLLRKLLGSVSAKVAAEAQCTVTVVRPNPIGDERPAAADDIGGADPGRRQPG